MKKWPLLLVLPLGVAAVIGGNSFVQARAALEPIVKSQAELDEVARKNPGANFDKLGHAFGNSEAHLFWNTYLDAAKRQAAREGKPILALRMLGNLSDEYSCANSRFFRVVFYPQAQISERLRRDFVLFWSRERPVPIITIDMGDGRILKRTITGNSAHYVLDSSGRPLDAYAGLSTPTAFDAWLASSSKLAQEFKTQPEAQRTAWLAKWHKDQLQASLKLRPQGRFARAKNSTPEQQVQEAIATNPLEDVQLTSAIPANVAAPLAVSKMGVEAPLLGRMNQPVIPRSSVFLTELDAPPLLDEATRARIRAMNPLAAGQPLEKSPVQNVNLTQTQSRATQKSSEENRFQNLIRGFEATLRADTVQNQNFAVSIHALFANGHEGDFENLNRRIYDRLFLTPRSDQWLGLTSDTAFSGLQNDGITLATKENTRLDSN